MELQALKPTMISIPWSSKGRDSRSPSRKSFSRQVGKVSDSDREKQYLLQGNLAKGLLRSLRARKFRSCLDAAHLGATSQNVCVRKPGTSPCGACDLLCLSDTGLDL